MLNKRHLDRYADVLLWALTKARGKKFKKNEIILIRFDLLAGRLAEVLQGKILDMGLHPILRAGPTPMMERTFYQKANAKQLVFQEPGEKLFYRGLDGGIFINAPDSLTHLSDIDPKKIGKAAKGKKHLRDILEKKEQSGAYGWTLCIMPTDGLAREANLSLRQYTNQVIRACYLDNVDPVKAWEGIIKEIAIIKTWLNSLNVKYFHIESNNIDLKIQPGKRRKWIGVSGHNIPSFEIFVSPDWRGTEGRYYADQPSFRNGNYVEGVRLFFKKGAAVNITAKTGEAFVRKQLLLDKGAGRIGEFSLTDKRFSRISRFMANTLYDENCGSPNGNCHVALGASYADTYDGQSSRLNKERKEKLGFNDSALHWDLVNTEKKTVTAHLNGGGKVVVYENGFFRC